ncbi:MAG: leucine-rich repeat domain-containing protein, partial [Aureispira sp.]
MLFPYSILSRTFVLFCFLFFCNLSSSSAQTRQADSLELVAFYNSSCLGCTLNWNFTQPMTSWLGVSLSNGRVTELNLNSRGLGGTLPNLSLDALEELILSNNQFTGSIPNFSNLPNLQTLTLINNQLTGAIPNFSNLPNLQILELYNNQLSGIIPDFSNLPNAFRIYLDNNRLSGSIPNFTSLTTLVFLRFGQNQLTGSVPDFSNLPQLRQLHLQDNQLTGNIPDFSNVPQLSELYLEDNQLFGPIPNFSNLPQLQYLRLQNNQLSGNIPNFINSSTLRQIYLSNNQLTGAIPDFSLPNLSALQATTNQLTGIIPAFNGCPSITQIYIENNQFTFEHLLANYSSSFGKAGNGYQYAPQDSIGTAALVSVPQGSNYTLDLVVDDAVTTNVYYWFKDGVLIDSTFGVNEYTIVNFRAANVGVYTARVVNSLATNPGLATQALVLNSRPVQLNLSLVSSTTATIPGLPARVCANRMDTILFYRDPAFLYSRRTTGSGFIDSNELVMSYSNTAPFITISNSPNNEVYGFIPSRLSPGDSVTVTASYTSIDTDNSVSPSLISILGFERATITIYIDSVPSITITTLSGQSTYCTN